MVEIGINPSGNMFLDIRKVNEHAEVIELIRLQRDDGSAVVSVKMFALSIILQKSVPVTKVNFLRDAKHQKVQRKIKGVKLSGF